MTIGEGTPPPLLPPMEMGNSQELLLKLVQLLTQLPGAGASSGSNALKIPIEGKIYVPQKGRDAVLIRQTIHPLPPLPQIQRQLEQAAVVVVGEGRGVEVKRPETTSSTTSLSKLSEKAQLAPTRSESKQSSDMNSFSRFFRQPETASSLLPKQLQNAVLEVKAVLRFLSLPSSETAHSKPEQVRPSSKQQAEPAKANPQPSKTPIEGRVLAKSMFPQERGVSFPKGEQKLAAPLPFPGKQSPHPSPLPLSQRMSPPQELPLKAAQALLEGGYLTSAEAKGEQTAPLVPPKITGLAPFHTAFTPRLHLLKKSKKTEKSMFWQEEEPKEDKEDQEEE